LYTSETNKTGQKRQISKTIVVYLALSAFCIIFDQVYALFGHDIRSDYMTYMFFYPLIGGALLFIMMLLLIPQAAGYRYYRLFYNLHNSGIAALTVKSMLEGIFEIAGTSSPYMIIFAVFGWAMIITGLIVLLLSALNSRHKE
jgi:hypothetical protein